MKATLTFEAWSESLAKIEAGFNAVSQKLREYPRNGRGGTLDSAKDAAWHQLMTTQATMFKQLQKANAYGVKHFPDELKAAREARFAAKLATK
jgi:hypothetical protein